MAEKDQGNEDDLKLELPSLPFGRKRKRQAGAAEESPAAECAAPNEAPARAEAAEKTQTAAPSAAPTEPERAVADDPTDVLPESPGRFAPSPAGPGATHEPAPAPYAAPETLGAADSATRPEPPPRQPLESADDEPGAVLPEPAPASEIRAKKHKPARPRRAPRLPGTAAAVLVGLLVGILACGATYAGLLGCQEVKGTSACGGPGFFILLAIVVVLVWLGGFLLRFLGVGDPGSTSFLGVGLMAVVALAFLLEVISEWWMILVVPGVGALTFAAAHWLTARFGEPTHH